MQFVTREIRPIKLVSNIIVILALVLGISLLFCKPLYSGTTKLKSSMVLLAVAGICWASLGLWRDRMSAEPQSARSGPLVRKLTDIQHVLTGVCIGLVISLGIDRLSRRESKHQGTPGIETSRDNR